MIIHLICRAVLLGVPLLYGSTGEIVTEKSGHLNLGIPGVMYVGAISGVTGALIYENSCGNNIDNMNPFLAIIIPLLFSTFPGQSSLRPGRAARSIMSLPVSRLAAPTTISSLSLPIIILNAMSSSIL